MTAYLGILGILFVCTYSSIGDTVFLHCFHFHYYRICFRNYGVSALIFSEVPKTKRNMSKFKQNLNVVLTCMSRVKWCLNCLPYLALEIFDMFLNQFRYKGL